MNALSLKLGRLCPRFLAVALTCLLASPAYPAVSFHVDLDTAALVGDPAGPFSLSFQLIGGGGAGTSNAVINNLTLTGGSLQAGASSAGNISGDLASALTLSTVGSFYNEFIQPFLAGSSLGFDVALTGVAPFGPTPDAFSFAVLDALTFQIPTTDPLGLSLVGVAITSNTLTLGEVKAYSSVTPISGVTARVSAIPTSVPDSDVLGAFVIAVVALIAFQRLRLAAVQR